MTAERCYSDEDLATARRLGTATLHEACGIPESSIDPSVRTVWQGATVAGAAYPVECAPGDNLAIHIAMEKAPPGSVLVVDAKGFVAGYWGEVLTVAAEAAGVLALVIDGGVRDVGALRSRSFPCFARGVSMRGTIKASIPSVGESIHLCGTRVCMGDLVVADDDGVLVLPKAVAHSALRSGEVRETKEEAMMSALKAGESTLNLLNLSHWRQS